MRSKALILVALLVVAAAAAGAERGGKKPVKEAVGRGRGEEEAAAHPPSRLLPPSATVQSPLDDGHPPPHGTQQPFFTSLPSIAPPSDQQTAQDVSCARTCSAHVLGTLKTLMKPGNNSLRMHEVCQDYERARECVEQMAHCGTNSMFDVVTSGLHYMCVEQRAAFNATIECVDSASDAVHAECETTCRVSSMLTALGVKDALMQGFDAVRKAVDANMMRIVMSEGCRIGQCLLKCYKLKFNARCDGSAGTLLSEVFVRPFALGHRSTAPLGQVFRLVVPEKCSFLLDPGSLQELRIDPALEDELKRMYSQPRKSLDDLIKVPTGAEPKIGATGGGQPPMEPSWLSGQQLLDATSPLDRDRRADSRLKDFTDGDADVDQMLEHLEKDAELEAETIAREMEMREAEKRREEATEKWNELLGEEEGKLKAERKGFVPDRDIVTGSLDDGQMRAGTISGTSGEQPVSSGEESDWSTVGSSSGWGTNSGESGESSGAEESGIKAEETSGTSAESEEDDRSSSTFDDRDDPGSGIDFDSKTGVHALRMKQMANNADYFLAQQIRPGVEYALKLKVKPQDKGELVCVLHTDRSWMQMMGGDDEWEQ